MPKLKAECFLQRWHLVFSLRLWTWNELLEALFANFDRLDEDLKAELPLKRIWTVAVQDGE